MRGRGANAEIVDISISYGGAWAPHEDAAWAPFVDILRKNRRVFKGFPAWAPLVDARSRSGPRPADIEQVTEHTNRASRFTLRPAHPLRKLSI